MQISFSEVINQLVVMMLIIATGFIAKKFKILSEDGDKIISGLVVNITSPALIVTSMSVTLDSTILKNILIIALMTVCTLTFSYFVSNVFSLIRGYTDEEQTIYRFSVIFGNASFLGFPLCYGLFGKIGLLYASVYSAIQDTFFWSLGVGIMAGKIKGARLRNLVNPNMIAILTGFALLLSGIQLPAFAEKTLSTVGSATVPLALMMVGSGFYRVELRLESLKDIFLPGAIKLVIIPAIAATILFFLKLEPIVKYVLLLELSMPCAASSVVLARNYDRDYRLASKVVMSVTVLSMLTIPLLTLIVRSLW